MAVTKSAYRNSLWWYELKEARRKIDDNKCVICKQSGNLELHHIAYTAPRFRENVQTDVVMLCRECHQRVSERSKDFEK